MRTQLQCSILVGFLSLLPAPWVLLAGEQSEAERELVSRTSTMEPKGAVRQPAISVPTGFKRVASWTATCPSGTCNAVSLYKKDWSGGQPDYVTVIDLRYAKLSNITGTESGAPCAIFGRKKIDTSDTGFWKVAKAKETSASKLRVVINGAFFDTGKTPAPVAFGLKIAGTVRSYGYGTKNGICGSTWEQGESNTLVFVFNASSKGSWIGPYSKAQLDNKTPDQVGALNPQCCKSPTSYTGRTVVGIRDDNSDGTYETVFLFSSSYARLTGVNGADGTLAQFGATTRAQLDGGSSTGLVVNGTAYITSGRTVPHAIAVFSP